jgi:hypothetical protein
MRARTLKRSSFRLVGGAVLLSMALTTQAQGSVVFAGACLVDMSLDFTPRAKYTSIAAASVDIDISGTCVTDADTGDLPDSLIKMLTVGGSGSVLVDNCAAFSGSGLYTASLSPAPAPSLGGGTFLVNGDLAAVSVTLVGLSPLLVGEGVLAGIGNASPAIQCAGTGASSMSFTGVLVFSDP